MLMAGCGNSRLSEDMFEDGFANISNVDISRVVIDQMGDKYKDKPALTFQQMNVCSLEFPDESFDAVIVKGTMDAILCGEGSTANVAKMCMEVSRVLKPSGSCSWCDGVPDNRMQYLENEDHSWTVTTHTVPKPTVSATAVPDTKDANSVHYIYVCAKGGNARTRTQGRSVGMRQIGQLSTRRAAQRWPQALAFGPVKQTTQRCLSRSASSRLRSSRARTACAPARPRAAGRAPRPKGLERTWHRCRSIGARRALCREGRAPPPALRLVAGRPAALGRAGF